MADENRQKEPDPLKKTIMVSVRFDESEYAAAEQNRRRLAAEIISKLPGIKFTLSDMLRSLAIASPGVQRKQCSTLSKRTA
jgi:hypothetical protein